MRRHGRGTKVAPAASGSEWETVKRLAAFDAANGWPFDFALMMLVVYGLLRLIELLLSPVRAVARVATARPRVLSLGPGVDSYRSPPAVEPTRPAGKVAVPATDEGASDD